MELNHTSGMTFSTLTVETTDTHTLVRLNRPEIRNAVDQDMVDDLHAVCDELEDDPRVLVITGCEVEGRNSPKGIFASGADITQLRDRRRANALAGISSRIIDRIATLAMPVIAAVDDLALAVGEVTGHPERICGLHFFNPVPASKLIEVIIADASAGELRELAPQWVTALGKTPVVVKNRPGFASSRLGLALGLEAMRMVEEDVASAEDIDNAMTLGYKHPVGPLALTDIVGLDVRLGIAEYLSEELGDRFTPPQILRDKVAVGELGHKSGKGFYDYN